MNVYALVMHYEVEELTDRVVTQLSDIDVDMTVVFDDGSQKPYERSRHKLTVIRSERNLGFVKGTNLVMEKIAYKAQRLQGPTLVWMLNSDITGLTQEMLTEMKMVLGLFWGVAAVTPAVAGSPHTEMLPGPEKFRRSKFIDWVCPLVRVVAWNAIGGFDENLKGYGCDLDMCYRARDHDLGFGVLPQLVVEHEMGGTVNRIPNARGHNDLDYMNEYLCKKYNVSDWRQLKT